MRKSILIVAVLVFACGKNASEPAPAATQPASPPPSQPAAQTAAQPAAAPSPAPVSGAIASADGEKSGTHIDITELKRSSGGTVSLKLVLSNAGPERLGVNGDWLGDNHVSKDSYRDVSGIHLLDPVNKKKYFVVTDAERRCVCSKGIEDVAVGGKVNLWAKFPAPPPEVTKVTIEIPHFQPMDDVPIGQ